MKKIATIVLVIVLLIVAGTLSFLIFNKQKPNNQISLTGIDSSQIRPEIKIYLDELYDSEITSIEHTTDSIEESTRRFPDNPKIFEAGRFKVVLNNDGDKKVMIFQTEEKVGHIAPVIPGKTDVGGYVEIQRNPESDNSEDIAHTTQSIENQDKLNNIADLKLNEFELDYLIRILYKKFEKPLTDEQAQNLNEIKDYALAIKFSGRDGITQYHNSLVNELKK
ncbi:MAG: hypothetical protein UV64_C0008G0001 [Parcubacteria group bacterium GW2011_GWC1_43_11b]|uniref:Uncharacterized protein n=2 Tax=Candidatus Vogeliibacteriota TaxID=1817922 RepID=A0A1G2QEP1_9BACT|nr:MAG: hypothetical protein UV50_C0002G0028 [Parcubacteria group bacterium GW2011_GWB1_42_9]KKS89250.1 MAG: hypothetical protein UV64_C0008G0001 [Parcubacteria group bacterium GW2011_GWC1_43_11b]KKT10132.1 MAG: hypothetical protein UV88_C0001G0028 [Parcubacteria group bacterium GW2011_GWA1_43_21]OHA59034.1 MAG: hypothetical protein A2370_00745 [Candidatus Vogelbacteria bacterium RIFOXYB1_FULL_42_16]OHA60007.1 MAG: hypothetical protein A2607_01850 [Candidatus Vogelbacteria bacterium RIFOXYD1_FU